MAPPGISPSAAIRRPRLPVREPNRRGGGESRRALVVIVLLVLAFAALGLVGTNVAFNYRAERAIVARMGPVNTKSLPSVTVRMGNGRQVDIDSRLELREGVRPDRVIIDADRLRDRMVDRISNVPPEALEGAAGAKLVKDALGAAVRTETETDVARGVLLDRLVVH